MPQLLNPIDVRDGILLATGLHVHCNWPIPQAWEPSLMGQWPQLGWPGGGRGGGAIGWSVSKAG